MPDTLCSFIAGRGKGHWVVYAYDTCGAEWRFDIPYFTERDATIVADAFRTGILPIEWENWDCMDYVWED